MKLNPTIGFCPFRLNGSNGSLYRGDTELALRPKTLAILWLLATRSNEVVSKETLVEQIWPGQAVSDASLAVCMCEIRKVLGDNSRQPRYVQTLHRRGYRFIAQLDPVTPVAFHLNFVGRSQELAILDDEYSRVCHGERRLVFIIGDAGIGKSALIETWAARLDEAVRVRVVTGQCVEQIGAVEAYLPFLEAIRVMSECSDGEHVVAALRRLAPTWLLQLPALQNEAERDLLQEQASDFNAERMRSELADLLEALSADRPLVLVIEDMHWCDLSSATALAVLINRTTPARLMVVASYRPADIIECENPLTQVLGELKVRKRCHELMLDRLTEANVSTYLGTRFKDPSALKFAAAVCSRTEGHPLFMVMLSDYLVTSDFSWASMSAADITVPVDLIEFIELRVNSLGKDERLLLGAASIAGSTFTSAEVLAALGPDWSIDSVERTCDSLCQRVEFIAELGVVKWRDGTVTGRYIFRHALYPKVIRDRIGSARRARLHQAVGERLENGFVTDTQRIAATLATHFEYGLDIKRAVRYLIEAVTSVSARYASYEASQLLRHGLDLVESNSVGDELAPLELELLLALGSVLTSLEGYGAEAVAAVYDRAHRLCATEVLSSYRFVVLRGLASFHLLRADYATAYEIGLEILQLAPTSESDDDGLYLEGHLVCGSVDYLSGRFTDARNELQRSLDVYNMEKHSGHALLHGIEPGVIGMCWQSVTSWMLGEAVRALEYADAALELAESVGHPFSLCQCHAMIAFLQQLRGNVAKTQVHSDKAAALAEEHRFAYLVASEQARRGWIMVQQGNIDTGISHIREGLTLYSDTGAIGGLTAIMATLAEAYLRCGEIEQGRQVVSATLTLAEQHSEAFFQAELLHLQGELERNSGSRDSLMLAVECFTEAISLARQQQARAWEVRATISLAGLRHEQGDQNAARDLLAPIQKELDEYAMPQSLSYIRQMLTPISDSSVSGPALEGSLQKR